MSGDEVNPVHGMKVLESRNTFQLKLASKTKGDLLPAALWTIYAEASAQNKLAQVARARIRRWSRPRQGIVSFYVEDDRGDVRDAIEKLNGVSRNGFPLPKPSFDVRHEDLVLPRHAALVSHAGKKRGKRAVPPPRPRVGSERTLLYVLKGHASEREAVVAALVDAYLVVERLNPETVPHQILGLRAATHQTTAGQHVVELLVRCHKNVAVAWNADVNVVGHRCAPPQMRKKMASADDSKKLSWVFDEQVDDLVEDAKRLLDAAERPRSSGNSPHRPYGATEAAFDFSLVIDFLGETAPLAPFGIGALGIGAILLFLGIGILLTATSLALMGAIAVLLLKTRHVEASKTPEPAGTDSPAIEGSWAEIRNAIAAGAPSLLPQIETAQESCGALLLAAPDVTLPDVIDAKLGATKRLDDLVAAYRRPAALARDGEREALAQRLAHAVIDIGREAEEARLVLLDDAAKDFEAELRYLESRREQGVLTSLPSANGDA